MQFKKLLKKILNLHSKPLGRRSLLLPLDFRTKVQSKLKKRRSPLLDPGFRAKVRARLKKRRSPLLNPGFRAKVRADNRITEDQKANENSLASCPLSFLTSIYFLSLFSLRPIGLFFWGVNINFFNKFYIF